MKDLLKILRILGTIRFHVNFLVDVKSSFDFNIKICDVKIYSFYKITKIFNFSSTPFTPPSTHKITTLSSTKLKDNLNTLSSVYPSEPLQNSPDYLSTTISKRTTRSTRSSQNFTTITPSGSKGNWRSSISPFPWYFVAIGGFLFASIIFIFVFMTVRGFRQIFTKRTTQNSASTIEKSNTSESMIPMINHKKRRTNKIIKSKLIKTEGTTKNETKSPKTKNKNESVNSECTIMNEEDSERLELKEGKQITVIDPLLNQVLFSKLEILCLRFTVFSRLIALPRIIPFSRVGLKQ
ncbi:unnamed protein product [Meloidogyne enterolobii]|uniref:Uncharacterized protein n=1 Tax=Meloidogyne enterolobii TaxID=390850 RepID=A0ACB0ZV69_MELEN